MTRTFAAVAILVGLAGCGPSAEMVALEKVQQDAIADANKQLALAQLASGKAAELRKHYYEVTLPACRAAFDGLKIGSPLAGIETIKCRPHLNTTETARGTHDQFVFEDIGYLYYDNGRLTAKQRTY